MKQLNIIVAPLGIVRIFPRDNEEFLLLKDMEYVGVHPYCGSGYVIFLEGVVSKVSELSNRLKCARCNMVLATFPAEIQTYGLMRQYFEQAIRKHL